MIPDVVYNGNDTTTLRIRAAQGVPSIPDPPNLGDKEYNRKYTISIDGERLDPGLGIICEVHSGLVKFIADSKLRKYQPTQLAHFSRPKEIEKEQDAQKHNWNIWVNGNSQPASASRSANNSLPKSDGGSGSSSGNVSGDKSSNGDN